MYNTSPKITESETSSEWAKRPGGIQGLKRPVTITDV